ncbi:MAG: ABC transporter ATP-binding protein [Ignavibacteriaceae bacterium]|nr:ABC transporter ATP-binding protein [Ignavibacteriaceae bacterium]
MIKIENLSKSYKEGNETHNIIDNFNLFVEKPEFIVILGKSGSGKTTLLNLLTGIDKPDSGKIFLNTTEISSLSEPGITLFRRKHTGIIFQFFNLLPSLTVLDNVLLPLELNENLNKTSKNSALELLSELNLKEKVKSFPDILSGGEQQRVAIARALVHNPSFIIADEPTGNLDFETADTVFNMLLDIVKKKEKTLIMATHNRDLAKYADRVLNFSGKHIEVTFNSGNYA